METRRIPGALAWSRLLLRQPSCARFWRSSSFPLSQLPLDVLVPFARDRIEQHGHNSSQEDESRKTSDEQPDRQDRAGRLHRSGDVSSQTQYHPDNCDGTCFCNRRAVNQNIAFHYQSPCPLLASNKPTVNHYLVNPVFHSLADSNSKSAL